MRKVLSLVERLAAGIVSGGGDPEAVFARLDTDDPEVWRVVTEAGAVLATLAPRSPLELLRAEISGTHWNENITDKNFPGADANVSIDGVRPVKIGEKFTRDEAIATLRAMTPPMKPATLSKCIRWCAANPDYQRTHWMMCFAQGWTDADGIECVVYFSGGTQGRRVGLYAAAGQYINNEVLAEPI